MVQGQRLCREERGQDADRRLVRDEAGQGTDWLHIAHGGSPDHHRTRAVAGIFSELSEAIDLYRLCRGLHESDVDVVVCKETPWTLCAKREK